MHYQLHDCICFETDSSPTLLVNNDKEIWIFDWMNFLHMKYDLRNKLVLTFATHEIHIIGHNFKELLRYIKNKSLSSIECMEERFWDMALKESVLIKSIIVQEKQESELYENIV